MPRGGVQPSFASGFARNGSLSEAPEQWIGLTGDWAPFLGHQGPQLFDVSGYGGHGTIVSATSWTIGAEGQQLSFNGLTGQVDMGDLAAVKVGAGEFTIVMRVNIGSNNDGLPAIMEKGNGNWSSGQGQGWWIGYVPGFNWQVCIGDTTSGFDQVSFSNLINVGYKTIAMRVTTSIVAAYVDGVLSGSVTRTKTGSTDTTDALNIGRWKQFDRTANATVLWARFYNLDIGEDMIRAIHVDPFAKYRLRRRSRVRPVSGAQTLDIAGSLTMAGVPRSDVSKQFAGVL